MTQEQILRVLEEHEGMCYSKEFLNEIKKYYDVTYIGQDFNEIYFIEQLDTEILI